MIFGKLYNIFIPLKGLKIDVMQTNALGAPLNKPNAPAKMCYLLLTIIRTISKIFMMVPPVAKTEEMANHGGSGGRHGQNRALKTKNNALGGKKLSFVFWRRFVHRAMAGVRNVVSNQRSSSVQKKFVLAAILVPFKGIKNAMDFWPMTPQ